MLNGHAHPPDEMLLLGIDRELPPSGQASLDRHLAACEPCRSRSAALAEMTGELSRLCHADASSPSLAALRQRLQAGMAESLRSERSPSWRVLHAVATVPVVVRVAAVLAIVVAVFSLVRPAGDGVSLTMRLHAESLPIHEITPGATDPISREALCTGRLPRRTSIPTSVREDVLRRYGMETVPEREYELDYLITPELGGTADPRNLWPERYASGVWNARVKDDLERVLPRLVCDGAIDLATAQRDIAENWIAAYRKYLKTDRPIARQAGAIAEDDDEIPVVKGQANLK